MEIQSGSIEAKFVRNAEIDEKIRNFGKDKKTGELDIIKCSTIVVKVDSKKLRNEVDSTGANSSGSNAGGICTALESYEAPITIVIPVQNAVECRVFDETIKEKGNKEKGNKEKGEIGE